DRGGSAAGGAGFSRLLPRVLRFPEPALLPVELRAGAGVLPPPSPAGTGPRVLRRAGVAVPRSAAGGAEAPGWGTAGRRGRLGGVTAATVVANPEARPRRGPVPGAPGVRPPVRGPVRRVCGGRGDLH